MTTFSISQEIERLEEDLKELKDTSTNKLDTISKNLKNNWIKYLWFIGPIILIALFISALYFSRPKLIRKGRRINMNKFFIYSFLIILIVAGFTGLTYWFLHK